MAINSESNEPGLWLSALPVPNVDGNKYHRGYVAIYGAPELTGATRLAAHACNRIGAGLVSVIAEERGDVYRTCLSPDIMVSTARPEKVTVGLGGSGGISEGHFQDLLNASHLSARIFDAGALPSGLAFNQLDQRCILTPHHGEFERVFGKLGDDPVAAARNAARLSGAHVVLKGARTIIASPDGQVVVNDHASPYLAKAGTGDVLAGMIAGLVAQNMAPLLAAIAAVWMHGEAAIRFGPGLIASDIADMLPGLLQDLLTSA